MIGESLIFGLKVTSYLLVWFGWLGIAIWVEDYWRKGWQKIAVQIFCGFMWVTMMIAGFKIVGSVGP